MDAPNIDDALLVDVGSSYLKATTSWSGSATTRSDLSDLSAPRPDAVVGGWDAERLVERVRGAIVGMLDGRPSVDRLFLSTHMRGYAIERDGEQSLPEPLVYVPWQDVSAELPREDGRTTVDHLRDVLPAGRLWDTGTVLRAGMPLANAAHWLASGNGPRTGRFHTLGSLLLSRLIGKHVTHETMAAATGFYDVVNRQWSSEIITLAGCEGLLFPEVLRGVGPAGEFIAPDGRAVRVFPDIGDSQAAALGAELDLRHAALISIGTAGLAAVDADRFTRTSQNECRPFFGRWLSVVSGLPGGAEIGGQLARGTTRELSRMLGAYRDAVDALLGNDHATPVLLSGGVSTAMPRLADVLSAALARPVVPARAEDGSLLGLVRLSASNAVVAA